MKSILCIAFVIYSTSAAFCEIHINRILIDPEGNENSNAVPEIVVLANSGDDVVQLGGWAIKSTPPNDSPDFWVIPDGLSLGGQEEIAIYWHTPLNEEVNPIAGVPLINKPIITGKATTSLLNNDGGDLLLLDSLGIAKHYVQWSNNSQGLEAEAESAGIWTVGEYVERPGAGEWIVYDGEGYTEKDWRVEVIDEEIPTAIHQVTWSEIKNKKR